MTDNVPPPVYTQTDLDGASSTQEEQVGRGVGLHVLITPTDNAVSFQKGFLGAEGERAAIEGEIQIKGAETDHWAKVAISLRTVEKVDQSEVELGISDNLLFSRTRGSRTPLPSSLPFAIPLMADTPQPISTPSSSLSHHLTATIYPFDPLIPSCSKTLLVHTRRYTSHGNIILIHPETHTLLDPTRVEAQVPRTTFTADESIPVYVTIPPPQTELVVDQGIRLRNVRAELERLVQVKRANDKNSIGEADSVKGEECLTERQDGTTSATHETHLQSSLSKAPLSPISVASCHRTVIARSGASCRFHSSRTVKLRFILHRATNTGSPSNRDVDLPSTEYGQYNSDDECPLITQLTILHSVTFRLNICVSFVDMTTRREHISTIAIPITVLASPAPLPEVSREIDIAYQKKHDRPPLKTVRRDDTELNTPRYTVGEAGPSMLPNGAPPPFEEREAPPPFSTDEISTSSSSRLPTFLESESEIIIPDEDAHSLDHPPTSPIIVGEGVEFGFLASEQFDGHSEPMQRSVTPPPTVEMATRDTDLTQLAEIREPQMAMEALGLALDRHNESVSGERPPPPPPALDDPSDPPPSIDSDFRSPDAHQATSPPSTPLNRPPSFNPNELPPRSPTPASVTEPSHGHAPPPYLVPGNHSDQENVTRPPPYVD